MSIKENLFITIMKAPLDKFADPEWLNNNVLQGDSLCPINQNAMQALTVKKLVEDNKAAEGLKGVLAGLNQTIAEASQSSTQLARKANRLTRWLVILTVVIALSACINAWREIREAGWLVSSKRISPQEP